MSMNSITKLFMGLLVFCFLGANLFATTPFYDYYDSTTKSTQAYYSVVLDERGLATVVLSLDYANDGSTSQDHIELSIPGENIKIINAFVRVNKERCRESYPSSCYTTSEFVSAEFENTQGNTYSIKLPQPVSKGQTASVLVFYRSFGYVKDGVLAKSFDFVTPTYSFDVYNSRVAVNVDQDLHLKDGGSSANYLKTQNELMATSSSGTQISSSLASSYYSYSRYSGGVVKQKSILLAGESFKVSGTYSKEGFGLYLPELLTVFAIVGTCLFFVFKSDKNKADQTLIKENSSDALLFSFACATAFSIATAAIVSLSIAFKLTGIDGKLAFVSFLVAWFVASTLVFLHKRNTDKALLCTLIFVGFCLILVPVACLLGAGIANLLNPPYLYY